MLLYFDMCYSQTAALVIFMQDRLPTKVSKTEMYALFDSDPEVGFMHGAVRMGAWVTVCVHFCACA